MGWVDAWTVGTVTGWGNRADHENTLLDNLHEKGYYPPIEMRKGKGNGACGGKGRTSDKRSLMGTGGKREV